MTSHGRIGFGDADAATLAGIVHEVQSAQAEIEAAQARVTRGLARALTLAQAQSRGASAQVKSRDMALRAIAAEIAAVTRSTDRSVQRRIGDAAVVVDGFPATMDAWEAGRITRAHVLLITDLGGPLPPDARAAFEEIALPRCENEVAVRLRGELAIVAERLHPRTLTERHAEAREDRCVTTFPLRDGLSGLNIIGPTVLIEAVYDRVTTQGGEVIDARAAAQARVRGRAAAGASEVSPVSSAQDDILASDSRSLDHIRADLLLDMLLTAQPGADPTRTDDGPGTLGAIRAKVQVVVPALTLLGADQHPADLVGRAPIDAETARTLAGATPEPWTRVLTHPVSGAVLATDTRFAEAPLRNLLKARDRHCRFPGCRVPAIRCETDHTLDYAQGGKTCVDNSAELCQRHHSMKQFTAWQVRQLGDGLLEWTSPLGHSYIDQPPAPTVQFVPDLHDPGAREQSAPPPKPTPPRTRFADPPPF
ncbi:HNH endonuclease signature motif containing protein [Microbacterium caowuchunii]|uniref:HNH endonuclease n=1 Tax=Microbacterium caowuchunii TaxID=2614638 RepID=A0A5N0TMJ1_9MICO|nr:HNH endonuclease signature motif containing protein [Microbacterium caowuchunii]KAA9135096.1 HNH endonuclease [Microbacterium caowuchunii]